MKNIRNIVCFAFVAGLALTACREDEQLDLAGYPGTGIGMGMVGEEEPVQAKMLRASYDSEGRLSVDGELTRSYTFTLAEASPEDLVLALEPVAVNVPAEKVELSAQEVRIPAGYRTSEAVEVKWLDEDFSFAAPDSEARTYEIGVRVAAMSGHKPAFSGEQEGKVVVEKEAYLSTFRLEPAGPVSFTRRARFSMPSRCVRRSVRCSTVRRSPRSASPSSRRVFPKSSLRRSRSLPQSW